MPDVVPTDPQAAASVVVVAPQATTDAPPPLGVLAHSEWGGKRPEPIPEKFWNTEKGGVNLDALIKSQADTQAAYSKLTTPPEQYQFRAPEGSTLPEWIDDAHPLAQSLAETFKAKGRPQEVVDDVMAALAASWQKSADYELSRLAEMVGKDRAGKLVADVGKMIPQVSARFSNGDAQAQAALTATLRGFANSAVAIQLLHSMFRAIPDFAGAAQPMGDDLPSSGAGAPTNEDLRALMASPAYQAGESEAFKKARQMAADIAAAEARAKDGR